MTNVKQQLHNMYVGLVCVNWANRDGTKLGTAKQKALQQMQSFAKTVDKKNPMAKEISANVDQMSKSVSKQIMTDKSSELTLDKHQAAEYKSFGERQVQQSKQALTKAIQNTKTFENRNVERDKREAFQRATQKQDMLAKQKAPQYRASQTNVPAKGVKPVAPQKMDQQTMIRIMMYQRFQNAA